MFSGSELRHYRVRAGLSREQLAAKINYVNGTISALGGIGGGGPVA